MGILTKPSQNLTAQGAIAIKNIGRAHIINLVTKIPGAVRADYDSLHGYIL